MKNQIGTVPKEKGFISTFRQHQGWWRTFVLNEPEGEYYYARNKETKKVCNRINNGDVTLKNFLSPGIVDAVNNALKHQEQHKSGIIDKERLYNNLLSSQPLAFNFFGFFKPDDEISLAFLQTIRPDITALEEIVFEYAPETSSDNSAFDFGFIVRSDAGRGFIGFECKYTDTFSYKRPKTKTYYGDVDDKNYSRYNQLYNDNRNRFPDDYSSYVKNQYQNQLFRNELLAVQLKNDFDFVVTGLFCHHDDSETVKAGYDFQKKIGNGENDFVVMTYADYFENIQKLKLTWEQRELVMMLWARYCGLNLSQHYIE